MHRLRCALWSALWVSMNWSALWVSRWGLGPPKLFGTPEVAPCQALQVCCRGALWTRSRAACRCSPSRVYHSWWNFPRYAVSPAALSHHSVMGPSRCHPPTRYHIRGCCHPPLPAVPVSARSSWLFCRCSAPPHAVVDNPLPALQGILVGWIASSIWSIMYIKAIRTPEAYRLITGREMQVTQRA
jgi:hypothetical protein